MKRGLIVLLLGISIGLSNMVFASDSMKDSQMKYYSNIASCTQGTFPIGFLGAYYIYGIKDNKCQIKESLGGVDIICNLPASVAKRYSYEGKKMLQESTTKGSGYIAYINQIMNDPTYCKVK